MSIAQLKTQNDKDTIICKNQNWNGWVVASNEDMNGLSTLPTSQQNHEEGKTEDLRLKESTCTVTPNRIFSVIFILLLISFWYPAKIVV